MTRSYKSTYVVHKDQKLIVLKMVKSEKQTEKRDFYFQAI